MPNFFKLTSFAIILTASLTNCTTGEEIDEDIDLEPDTGDATALGKSQVTDDLPGDLDPEAAMTSASKVARIKTIYAVAKEKGLTNGPALAGIAISETGLAHCWNEATWACKGPASSSCNGGPVIAGKYDGRCSIKQGGLGMFQFDAGTHAQTLAKYGNWVVTERGNTAHAVEFVADMIDDELRSVSGKAEALKWLNDMEVSTSSERLNTYATILSKRYNGCRNRSATCMKRRAKYRENILLAKRLVPQT